MEGSANLRSLTRFEQNRYLTYPHCNGFCGEGRFVVLGQIEPEFISLWRIDLSSGEEQRLTEFQRPAAGWIAFDIASATDCLTAVTDNQVWILDLRGNQPARCVFELADPMQGEGMSLQDLPSISRDGRNILAGINTPQGHSIICIETVSGKTKTLLVKPWFANHAHFCPYNESWIGFAHEGVAQTITDRVWGWHATLADEGCLLFDQQSAEAGKPLCVGHERWCFHDASALVVAYGRGISPAGPCGLYEVFADKRQPRLLSESDRYWHCNVSQDGRLATVDTSGPYDEPGGGWVNAREISDILVIDRPTGRSRFVARSSQGLAHPLHPHPVFTPDGTAILFNQASTDRRHNRVLLAELS